MKFLEKLIYNLNWWLAKRIIVFFVDYKIISKMNLSKLRGPLIIAANHISWADGFLIGVSFPFRSNIFPIRYAVIDKLYYVFYPFLKAIGSFPIKKGVGLEKSLQKGVESLKHKGTIAIFPEGKVRPVGNFGQPKRGVAFLAIKTGAPILPIKIETNRRITPLNFILRRCRVNIKIGNLFHLPCQEIKNVEELNQYADFVMQKIREL